MSCRQSKAHCTLTTAGLPASQKGAGVGSNHGGAQASTPAFLAKPHDVPATGPNIGSKVDFRSVLGDAESVEHRQNTETT